MTQREKLLQQALDTYKKNNYNGISLLPTGFGKGRLMIEIAKILKPNSILYLCDSEKLRDITFIDELRKWDAMHLLPRMELVCYQTAYKWKDKHYDLLLADEFDAALTPNYSKVFKNNTFTNMICVSATLEDKKRAIAKTIAPIIFEKKQKELIENGVLNKIQYYRINYHLTSAENKAYLRLNERFVYLLNLPQTKSTRYRLEKLQIERKQFLSSLNSSAKVTRWLLNSLSKKNEKVLIFCGLSEQADKVCEHSYHSNNDNETALNLFEKGEIKALSVVEKITRGVNIAEVRNIILETIGRSQTKLTQKIGRGLRLLVNETLSVFFLVPYYRHPTKGIQPTIVQDWLNFSTREMDLSNIKTINYNES